MNFNQKILWAAVVCAALASQAQQATNNLVRASEANAEAPSSSGTEEKYVIGPEDVLNINVWRQPELSAVAVPVRPDGKISLPLLNDVQAANLTPMQLVAAITEQLKKFVSDPQVTVVVTAINSKRIYVMGEVVRAGVFPMAPNMTVLQALSSAGGFQQYANPKKIYILRKDEAGKNRKITFNYKRAIQGGQAEGDILLMPGDTIVVP
ncbi:MAG TPA: polysaccharide biosynthesis/export family protein [Candidatus Angelobacter sp.]|nr:polysaccharide biosynthesis/export family protein [Candidatus Angelobacter sp.]